MRRRISQSRGGGGGGVSVVIAMGSGLLLDAIDTKEVDHISVVFAYFSIGVSAKSRDKY